MRAVGSDEYRSFEAPCAPVVERMREKLAAVGRGCRWRTTERLSA